MERATQCPLKLTPNLKAPLGPSLSALKLAEVPNRGMRNERGQAGSSLQSSHDDVATPKETAHDQSRP